MSSKQPLCAARLVSLSRWLDADLKLQELAEIEAHVAVCEDCRCRLHDMRTAADLMADLAEPMSPRRSLTGATLQRLREAGALGHRERRQAPSRAWRFALLGAAVMVLAILAGRLEPLSQRRTPDAVQPTAVGGAPRGAEEPVGQATGPDPRSDVAPPRKLRQSPPIYLKKEALPERHAPNPLRSAQRQRDPARAGSSRLRLEGATGDVRARILRCLKDLALPVGQPIVLRYEAGRWVIEPPSTALQAQVLRCVERAWAATPPLPSSKIVIEADSAEPLL